jgi:uncharacterized protein YneF (UPF0154 family)
VPLPAAGIPEDALIVPEPLRQQDDTVLYHQVLKMLFELLDLLIGIIFGFFHKGKEDYTGILRNGAIVGIVVGVVFGLVMYLLAPGSVIFNFGYLGIVGLIIDILIFVVIFFAGVYIGDWIERFKKR